MKQRALKEAERLQWASLAHSLLLQAIAEMPDWGADKLVFHGGTSLHLSWNSPRYSEDLDFLLLTQARERLGRAMQKVLARARDALAIEDPMMRFEARCKEKERLTVYQVSLGRPDVQGKVMVKLEFWAVPLEYLQHYRATLRQPGIPMNLGGYKVRVQTPMPVASLEAAFFDKLTAFATRPHLKWRDLFDLWWLHTRPDFIPPTGAPLVKGFLHAISAYKLLCPTSAASSLRLFATRHTRQEILDCAPRDLRPFIPIALWSQYWPERVGEMVDLAITVALRVADEVERAQEAEQTP